MIARTNGPRLHTGQKSCQMPTKNAHDVMPCWHCVPSGPHTRTTSGCMYLILGEHMRLMNEHMNAQIDKGVDEQTKE